MFDWMAKAIHASDERKQNAISYIISSWMPLGLNAKQMPN